MPERPEILKILVDIVRREMRLKADQVVIYNQRWIIPPDDRLYVAISVTGSAPFGVNRKYASSSATDPQTGQPVPTLNEELSVNTRDILTFNIYSASGEARERRNELIFALESTYAEQQMEKYSFLIGSVPTSYVDVSEEEGTKIINRYAITYNVQYAQSASNPVEYFDKFQDVALTLQP
jgi:hypothetical protein